jgi:hypothetical protein
MTRRTDWSFDSRQEQCFFVRSSTTTTTVGVAVQRYVSYVPEQQHHASFDREEDERFVFFAAEQSRQGVSMTRGKQKNGLAQLALPRALSAPNPKREGHTGVSFFVGQ